MQTQAIIRESYTTTYTFAGVPSEETRRRLKQKGFQFDGKTGQWYRNHKKSDVIREENVAEVTAA